MLKQFRNTLYVRIEPEEITVTHAESGYHFSETPVLAIESKNGKAVILAVGQEALALSSRPNVTINYGFRHPRTLLADFTIAERTLKYLVKKAQPKTFFLAAPILVIHPLALLEGGLTQLEIRAFCELGAMAGARKVYIWVGKELTTAELTELKFPQNGGLLLFP